VSSGIFVGSTYGKNIHGTTGSYKLATVGGGLRDPSAAKRRVTRYNHLYTTHTKISIRNEDPFLRFAAGPFANVTSCLTVKQMRIGTSAAPKTDAATIVKTDANYGKIGFNLLRNMHAVGANFMKIIERDKLNQKCRTLCSAIANALDVNSTTYNNAAGQLLVESIGREFNNRFPTGNSVGCFNIPQPTTSSELTQAEMLEMTKEIGAQLQAIPITKEECLKQDLQHIQLLCALTTAVDRIDDSGHPLKNATDIDQENFFIVLKNAITEIRKSPLFAEYNAARLDADLCDTIIQCLSKCKFRVSLASGMRDILNVYFKNMRDREGEKMGIRGRIRPGVLSANVPQDKNGVCKVAVFPWPARNTETLRKQFTISAEEVVGQPFAKTLSQLAEAPPSSIAASRFILSDERMLLFNNPDAFLRKAVAHYLANQSLLSDSATLSIANWVSSRQAPIAGRTMQLALLGMTVQTKLPVNLKGTVGDQLVQLDSLGHRYVPRKTFSDVIYGAGLPIRCGPSGTTTDIIAGLYALNPEGTMVALNSLLNRVKSLSGTPNEQQATDLHSNFRQLFTSISSYMQLGQYHTAGEVLAGCYAAALALHGQEEQNIESFRGNLQRLMKNFEQSPETFFFAAEKV
jgi:hypothetical protein